MATDNHVVWFVCKDPGGTEGILPVERYLASLGVATLLIPNGKAIELLRERNLQAYASAEELLSRHAPPRVLVTSMCSGGGIGRELVQLLRGHCPTVTLQDFWGSGLWHDWADPHFRPNYIVVNDEVGADIVKNAWPGFPADHIKVLGYPALDKYAGVDMVETDRSVRSKLGIDDKGPIVLYAGQLAGTAETLREVAIVLDRVDSLIWPRAHFIPRLHPRLSTNAPAEYQQLNQALYNFRLGSLWPFTDVCSTTELAQAATVVVSEWSTVLVEAAALRKPIIAVLYPEEGMKRFQEAMGGHVSEFPLVSLGCAAKAENRDQFLRLLAEALDGYLGSILIPAQERYFKLDGQNASRVGEFVMSLL